MKTAPLFLVLATLLLVGCQSAPPPLSSDASPEIYFQRAQAASDQGQYDEALVLYRSFLKDHPDGDRQYTFPARYEIAFLLWKKGQTAEAQADWEGLMADFQDFEKSSGAPAWVKVLTEKKLQELRATKS